MVFQKSAFEKLRAYEEQIKDKIFEKILQSVELEKIELENIGCLKEKVSHIAQDELSGVHLSYYEKQKLANEVLEDIFGFGPIEPLLRNESISDILVNSPSDIFVDIGGKVERAKIFFRNREHLMHVIRKLANSVGRRIDESTPIVDAYMPDGSRVNAIIPPAATEPSLSIRKFVPIYADLATLVQNGTLSEEMAGFLKLCVEGKLNMIVSGSTGSGKTTLLGALSRFIPDSERIVTIEDSLELSIAKSNLVRLVTRQPNVEGKGEITQRNLVINALRMRPDRIIVGEVRSSEVWDMLTAMNTGHAGSLTTIHANSAQDALYRLETLAMMAGYDIGEKTLRSIISRSIAIVVHLGRLVTGERKVVSISEVLEGEEERFSVRDLYRFVPGPVEEGRMKGEFVRSREGLSQTLTEKMMMSGIEKVHIQNAMRRD